MSPFRAFDLAVMPEFRERIISRLPSGTRWIVFVWDHDNELPAMVASLGLTLRELAEAGELCVPHAEYLATNKQVETPPAHDAWLRENKEYVARFVDQLEQVLSIRFLPSKGMEGHMARFSEACGDRSVMLLVKPQAAPFWTDIVASKVDEDMLKRLAARLLEKGAP